MNNKEEFRDIKGYEGLYQVSNMGRVKSLERMVNAKGGAYRKIKERILKPVLDGSGYQCVNLCKDGKQKKKSIASLVAVAFLGHMPDGLNMVINHISGNKLCNELSNLEIVTNRENLSTCFRKDRDKLTSQYTGVFWCKTTQKWVAKIKIKGKNFNLGYFNIEIEASNAYEEALLNIDNPGYFEQFKPNFTSECKGVSLHKASGKYTTFSYIGGNKKYLGLFSKESDAENAVKRHEEEYKNKVEVKQIKQNEL